MLGLGTSILSPYIESAAAYSNTKSLSFAGGSGDNLHYVDTNYTSNALFQDSFSISMWVKPNDGQHLQTLFGVELGSSDVAFFNISSLGQLGFNHFSDSAFASVTTDASRFTNGAQSAFTHVVLTVTKNTGGNTSYAIYDDGTSVPISFFGGFRISEAKHAAFDHGGLEPSIGASNDDGTHDTPFGGLIDEVAIFTKALSSSEVTAIYNSGVPKDESAHDGLLLYYRFEDDVTDTAGTSNATNNGATFSSTVPS
tara:strand:+ start:1573 stop:2334 length:762 start_codon:yes stop_codon:yes gene_type:complete